MDSFVLSRIPEFGIAEPRAKAGDSSVSATSVSDEALVEEVRLGSREALALLFRRYAPVVRRVALRVLNDAAEADDLLQDVFLLLNRFSRRFNRSKGSAQSWIAQVTYRRAISRRRYLTSRHFYSQVELDEQSLDVAEPEYRPLGDPAGTISADLDLQKMWATLSNDQQRTLRLHFIEGYTLDEIATILGQTKGNIRHHSFRGLERLRKQIFVANCRAREQYDTRFAQARSRGVVSNRAS